MYCILVHVLYWRCVHLLFFRVSYTYTDTCIHCFVQKIHHHKMTNKNNMGRKPNTPNTGSDSSAHSQSDSVTQIGLDKADIQNLISEAISEVVFSMSGKLNYALEYLKGQQILVTSLLNKLRDKDNIITELEQKIVSIRQDMEFELNDFEQCGRNNSITIFN